MPKGPKGEKRPADVIGNAVKSMRILTGDEPEDIDTPESQGKDPAAVSMGKRGPLGIATVLHSEKEFVRVSPSAQLSGPPRPLLGRQFAQPRRVRWIDRLSAVKRRCRIEHKLFEPLHTAKHGARRPGLQAEVNGSRFQTETLPTFEHR
ncbi:MAG: hypothetical protein WDM79_02145 [Terricaulis sp.]